MNLSSKDANNIAYLEEVAVSHTKHFLVTQGQKEKTIAANSHFDSDYSSMAPSVGKLIVFNRDLAVKSI